MESGTMTGGKLLRLMGFMGICVGAAWALQVLAFHGEGGGVGRLLWILAAAAIAGGGTGLIVAAGQVQPEPSQA